MPAVEFQRLSPECDEGETSSQRQGEFFFGHELCHHGEPQLQCQTGQGSRYSAAHHCILQHHRWDRHHVVGLLQYIVLCHTHLELFPFFFLAGLLALTSRNKKTSMILMFMVCSTLAMLAALTMIGFMLVSAVGDYHHGYPFNYVRDNVAASLGVCFGFDIIGIILGFIEVFAALTGIMIGSDRNRQPASAHSMGCRVMGDIL